MAIGKESIKRAASVNNIAKEVIEVQEVVETTKTNMKPTAKKITAETLSTKMKNTAEEPEVKPVLEKKKEVISQIKSDLPIYLL